jgi:hypothetical protein
VQRRDSPFGTRFLYYASTALRTTITAITIASSGNSSRPSITHAPSYMAIAPNRR